jgi:hypothetical protein
MRVPQPRTLAAATALVLSTFGAIAGAAGGPAPLAPTDGKTLTAGTPFTFKVKSSPSGAVFFKVSTSKKKNAKGTLKTEVYFRKMIRKSGGIHTKKTETYPALDDYFLNKPGTYYWQAYRIDCAAQSDCEVEGRIRSFKIR